MGVQLTKESSIAQFRKAIFGGVQTGTNPPLQSREFEQSDVSPTSGIAASHRPLALRDILLVNRAGRPLLGATALRHAGAVDQAIQPLPDAVL